MINFTITKELYCVLEKNNIEIEDYAPAYNGESAGLDLYNVGNNINIQPASVTSNNAVQIPTGIKMNVPIGYVALIKERGSISKTDLKVRAGVIDAGYTGEVFANCVNIGLHKHIIYKDNKLPFQIVVVKCDNEFKIVTNEEFDNIVKSSKRKSGKIGSSDS
jgi:dUTP pyrophosphatase